MKFRRVVPALSRDLHDKAGDLEDPGLIAQTGTPSVGRRARCIIKAELSAAKWNGASHLTDSTPSAGAKNLHSETQKDPYPATQTGASN